MKTILGLAPNAFLLGLVSLFNDFSAEMIYAVMPAFLVGVLAAPPVVLGLIEGFADAFSSILKIFSGWLSDKIKKRKAITVVGYSLSLLTRLGLVFVTGFGQVFALRAFDRVGKGLRESPRDALLAESVAAHDRGRSFGYLRAMDQIGGIIGPLAAILLLPILAFDYPSLFLIGFGVGIFVLITFIFVRDIKKDDAGLAVKKPPKISFKNFSKTFKLFILSIFVFGLGVMPISLTLLKAGNGLHMDTNIPLMYLIYSVAFAIFAVPFGKLSDKFDARKVMAGGFVAAIIAYIILGASTGFFSVALGFIVFGIYSAMTDGVGRAIASKMVDSQVLASGQGLLGAVIGFSSLLSGILGGLIWSAFGSEAAFLYGIIMMSAGLVLFVGLNIKGKGV